MPGQAFVGSNQYQALVAYLNHWPLRVFITGIQVFLQYHKGRLVVGICFDSQLFQPETHQSSCTTLQELGSPILFLGFAH